MTISLRADLRDRKNTSPTGLLRVEDWQDFVDSFVTRLSEVADGGNAGYADTNVPFTSGSLFKWLNDGVEKIRFDWDGGMFALGSAGFGINPTGIARVEVAGGISFSGSQIVPGPSIWPHSASNTLVFSGKSSGFAWDNEANTLGVMTLDELGNLNPIASITTPLGTFDDVAAVKGTVTETWDVQDALTAKSLDVGTNASVVGAADIGGNADIGGELAHEGLKAGFYNTPPVNQGYLGLGATNAEIVQALVDLGLVNAFTPLLLPGLVDEWQARQVDCETEGAVYFDGTNKLISSPIPASMTLDGSQFATWAFDVNTDALGANQTPMSRFTGDSSQDQWGLRITATGAVRVYISISIVDGGSNFVDSTDLLVAGVSSRVVVVYDGTEVANDRVRIYVDGVEGHTAPTGTIATALTSPVGTLVTLGAVYANNQLSPLVGSLQSASISSQALSGAALTAAFDSAFYEDRGADKSAWDYFWNLPEASGDRAASVGPFHMTAIDAPVAVQGSITGPVQDNAPVLRWTGRRNALVLEQTTFASQPLWIESGQNGQPTIRGDGVDDWLRAVSFPAGSLSQPNTIYTSYKGVTLGEQLMDGGVNPGRHIFGSNSGAVRSIYAGTFLNGGLLSPDDQHIATLVFNTVSSFGRFDALLDMQGDVGAQVLNGLTVLADVSGNSQMAGDISHIIVQNALGTAQQINDTELYLDSLYNTFYPPLPTMVEEWDGAAKYAETDAACNFVRANSEKLTNATPGQLATNKMSIRVTATANVSGTFQGIVGKLTAGQSQFTVYYTNANKIALYIAGALGDGTTNGAETVASHAPLTDADIVLVYDGAQAAQADRIRIFVDGVEETVSVLGTIPATMSTGSTAPLDFGHDQSSYLDGKLQCVGITARALSASEAADASVGKFYESMPATEQALWDHFWNLPEESGVRVASKGGLDLTQVGNPITVAGPITGPIQNGARRKTWLGSLLNRAVTAPAFANQPIWLADAINGQPGASYDGVGDRERNDAAGVALSGEDKPYTVFAIIMPSVVGSGLGYSPYSLASGSSINPRSRPYINSTLWSHNRADDAGTSVSNASSTTPPIDVPFLSTIVFKGTTITMRVNGVDDLVDGPCDVGVSTYERFTIGGLDRTSFIQAWNGNIAHVILVKEALSAAQVTEIENRLLVKYGI